MLSNGKQISLMGYGFWCPVCGGHKDKQKLTKRRRAREKRQWRAEATA